MLQTTVLNECLELEFLFRHQFLYINQKIMQNLCDSINFLVEIRNGFIAMEMELMI